MYTCEYDYTSPVSREYITEFANRLYPNHTEIDCETFGEMEHQFWTGNLENIKMDQHYFIQDNSVMYCHRGRRWFSIVLHPGLNGETWYYGVLPLKAEVMATLKGGVDE
jgi:hypothetical protein